VLCARKMIKDHVELRIYMGDILKEQTTAIVFPADPDLTFQQPNIERMFNIQVKHLFELHKINPKKRVIKYDNLKLPNSKEVYFCAIPTWTGVWLRR
jgi:hypothetical protein